MAGSSQSLISSARDVEHGPFLISIDYIFYCCHLRAYQQYRTSNFCVVCSTMTARPPSKRKSKVVRRQRTAVDIFEDYGYKELPSLRYAKLNNVDGSPPSLIVIATNLNKGLFIAITHCELFYSCHLGNIPADWNQFVPICYLFHIDGLTNFVENCQMTAK